MSSLLLTPATPQPRATADLGNISGPFGLTAALALEKGQRRDVFALRHKSYLAGGYIDPRPRGLFSDPYDDLPNCQSIIVYRRAQPVAAVRVCVLDTDTARPGWQDIPAIHVFPEELEQSMQTIAAQPARETKRPVRAIEINRLVRHPDYANDSTLVFALFHLAGHMILQHDADVVFSCVRKNHVPFYKRLKFKSVAGPRSYPELKFSTNLLECSRENYESVQRMMPLLDASSPASEFAALTQGKTITVFGGR